MVASCAAAKSGIVNVLMRLQHLPHRRVVLHQLCGERAGAQHALQRGGVLQHLLHLLLPRLHHLLLRLRHLIVLLLLHRHGLLRVLVLLGHLLLRRLELLHVLLLLLLQTLRQGLVAVAVVVVVTIPPSTRQGRIWLVVVAADVKHTPRKRRKCGGAVPQGWATKHQLGVCRTVQLAK